MVRFFEVNDNLDLTLNKQEILTIVIKGENINLNLNFNDGSFKVLIFNDSNNKVNLKENYVLSNSEVEIDYLELNDQEFTLDNNTKVNKNSILNIKTIILGKNKKDIKYNLTNTDTDSKIDIFNNVVCLDDSNIEVDIIGNILKGAKRSSCHQKSNCLTVGMPKKAKVLPVLNIDENDVEASHSLSCGTIDEEVLYYMNSRGLSSKEALLLMVKSYLMPDEEFYKDFLNGDKIRELAERRVDSIC